MGTHLRGWPMIRRVFVVVLATVAGVSCGGSPAAPIVETPPLVFNPPTLPIATVGEPYSFTFGGAAGGQPPYHYQLDTFGGFPPIGLTLAPNGVLSGTPTIAGGPTAFAVCVVDVGGRNNCPRVTMTVRAAISGITFSYDCTIRTQPFRTMTCTGTADFILNVTVPSGQLAVTMAYGSDLFHGSAVVSARAGGPGAVHIANFQLSNYVGPCLPTYSSNFEVWDGVFNNNRRLAVTAVTGNSRC